MASATSFSSSSLLGLRCRRSNSNSSSCPMACRLSNKPHRLPLSLKATAAAPDPWLILPAEDAAYSLAEDRVFSLKKGKDWAAAEDAFLVGSSHGWLALYDTKSKYVFLWDPISGRHIKLPANPTRKRTRFEGRVILSCSPDEHGQECYAMQCSGSSIDPPAFCVVGLGAGGHWTELVPARAGVVYEAFLFGNYSDFAYCSGRKVWSFITKNIFVFDDPDGICVWNDFDISRYHQIDDWEIPDKNMRVDTTWFMKFRGPPHSWKENEDGEFLSKRCIQKLHLVYSHSHSRRPLVVVRFIKSSTVGFLVLEIEKEGGCIRVVDDLKGMALFVGMNHSFAINSATAGGGLMPNSIYYTPMTYSKKSSYTSFASNSDDVGIFDYQNKAFYPCCNHIGQSSTDMRLAPMWFTPNP